ncbi:SAM-dependent methyltransferase [Solihabitans fulvus]|uniref:S-adenosyl-L-methionine-dependent methyltransferase n=1 Tax=Solihabitans fulvus TaxID=1892852 RepID=A0A5B2X894_9PSEU|nr:SAM-dependent methyltransferase [Solihabitans fulvus]KAA2259413.1 SAM-dependent methyltransferase [Solihabitans fulvus]
MTADAPTGVGATALAVAGFRALESERADRLFEDPFAADFVAAIGGTVALEPKWVGLAHHVSIRTRFFDDQLLEAAEAGCRQVVLLAAGLDTRALRLAWPDGTTVFELDLPDVLAFKERVLAGRPPRCDRRTVVADLREDWPAALVAAGLRVDEPIAWLAEGILVYLTGDEVERLIGALRGVSPMGSRLALAHSLRNTRGVWRSTLTEEPVGWLARHGWHGVAHDTVGLSERYGRRVPGSGPSHAVLASAVRAQEPTG